MVDRHVSDTVTIELPRPKLLDLLRVLSWAGRAWVLAAMPALVAEAHNPTIAPPAALAGDSHATLGRSEGAGFFLAWHQPYGLPGVHVLNAGAGYAWPRARMHAHLERESWDGLWESRSATLGGALTWAGLRFGGDWMPRLEILSAGPGAQAPRLLTWDLSHFDLGVEWSKRGAQAVNWAVGSSYAPGQTRFWVQGESRFTASGLFSSAVWSARLTLQIPMSGLQPIEPIESMQPSEPIDPLAALRLAYAWTPGFSLVMSAEVPWSSRDDGAGFGTGSGASFSRDWLWSAALTLPWGHWRGRSLLQSQRGLPATLGAALGWGGWSGSEF